MKIQSYFLGALCVLAIGCGAPASETSCEKTAQEVCDPANLKYVYFADSCGGGLSRRWA